MEPEIGPAAFVRYRKAIAPDPDLAAPDNRRTDAACSDNDDTALTGAMCADAGDGRVMGVNNGMERMRMLRELIACPFAADPGKPDGSMDGAQRVGTKPGFF